jgi:hypothetical protein
VAALQAFAESAQKESALRLERLSRGEADIARLAAEVAALRGHSNGAQKQLAAHEEKLGGLDRTEADIARLVAEVVALRGHSEGAQKQLAPHQEKLYWKSRLVCDLKDFDFLHCEHLRAREEVLEGGVVRVRAATPASANATVSVCGGTASICVAAIVNKNVTPAIISPSKCCTA